MNRVHLIPLSIVGLWLLVTSVAGFSVDADTPCKRLALAKAAGICSKDYSPCRLPFHSNFKLLSITTSSGFSSLDSTPVELAGLESLYLNDNQLTDSEASALIKTLATTSVNSLTDFRLNDNKLTRIPDFLLSIPNLADLHLNNNAITSLSANSLAFRGPISISLGKNQIKSVRPGAFGSLRTLGTFGLIGLNLNKFNRLDSNAFQTLLEGMVIAGEGSLELGETPIVCDCNIAWLLRDNRHLLKHVLYGKCTGNGGDFADVEPERFNHCPAARM
ncbi:hypothetical protein DAPPUDRAFT_255778 [Daphnia pulex]|uniref:LRRCT domain-containing protein n=1 Tax=Daphnia pulex TaxID=6669 RepID=E9HA07_DAPPU|nr:hypothetical protein DAPPUDRAFT_255778 [Daphnia pulex]|eukprot:EFX71428.1 hypothetical protein DAPPUDRAFT_255778 [Daphnia pulex]